MSEWTAELDDALWEVSVTWAKSLGELRGLDDAPSQLSFPWAKSLEGPCEPTEWELDRFPDPEDYPPEILEPERVFWFVNQARRALRLDSLHRLARKDAVPGDEDECLLARALSCRVTDDYLIYKTTEEAERVREATGLPGTYNHVDLPHELALLVRKFDAEEITVDLVAPKSSGQMALEPERRECAGRRHVVGPLSSATSSAWSPPIAQTSS